MASCPSCGSNNILFKRERTNVSRNGSSIKWSKNYRTRSSNADIQYATVGMCKDCGYTWQTAQSQGCLTTIIIWCLKLVFFPITLSIWFYKSSIVKNKFIKILVIILFWILLLAISSAYSGKI